MAKAQARADAMIAEREAAGRKAMEEAAAFMATGPGRRERRRPAGHAAAELRPDRPLPPVRDMLKQALEGVKDTFGEMFDDRAGIIDPGPGANLNRPPPELEDSPQRAEWRPASGRRATARAPYRAAAPAALAFTRFATTGRTQLEEVTRAAHGLAIRLVCSASTASPSATSSTATARARSVEWEIAHAPGAPAGAAARSTAAFGRDGHWAARRRRAVGARRGRRRGRCARAPGWSRRTASASRACSRSAAATARGRASSGRRTWTARRCSAAPWTRSPAHEQLMGEAPLAIGRGRCRLRRDLTGRRSPRGSRRAVTARRARPRRSRTSRAAGRSCWPSTSTSSGSAARTATACR